MRFSVEHDDLTTSDFSFRQTRLAAEGEEELRGGDRRVAADARRLKLFHGHIAKEFRASSRRLLRFGGVNLNNVREASVARGR